jgi:hypothetical protein
MNLAMYDFDSTYVNVEAVPHLFKCFNEKGYHKKHIPIQNLKLLVQYMI